MDILNSLNRIWSLVGVTIIALLIQRCHFEAKINETVSDFEKVINFQEKRDSANLAKINFKAQDSIKMSQTIVMYETLNESLKKELEGYKNGTIVETRIITRIDTIRMLIDTLEIDYNRLASDNCQYADSLIKQFKIRKNFFNFNDNWITVNGTSSYDKVILDSVVFKNELDVILGYKREKWYKSRVPLIEIKSYNPYSKIDYANNIVVEDKRTSYEKVLTSKPTIFILGLIGGIVLNKL